jgi:hypothetical protein
LTEVSKAPVPNSTRIVEIVSGYLMGHRMLSANESFFMIITFISSTEATNDARNDSPLWSPVELIMLKRAIPTPTNMIVIPLFLVSLKKFMRLNC